MLNKHLKTILDFLGVFPNYFQHCDTTPLENLTIIMTKKTKGFSGQP